MEQRTLLLNNHHHQSAHMLRKLFLKWYMLHLISFEFIQINWRNIVIEKYKYMEQRSLLLNKHCHQSSHMDYVRLWWGNLFLKWYMMNLNLLEFIRINWRNIVIEKYKYMEQRSLLLNKHCHQSSNMEYVRL